MKKKQQKTVHVLPNNGKEIIFEAQRQSKLFWIGLCLIIDISSFVELWQSYDLPWFPVESFISSRL